MLQISLGVYDRRMSEWTPMLDRLLRDIRYDHGCWEWTGNANPRGYGLIAGRLVHRLVYRLLVGDFSEETLDHLCRNLRCCNPLHLEPVSRAENSRRGAGEIWQRRRAQRFCKHGHEFTAENTRTARNGKGGMSRWCRQCDRDRAPRNRHTKEIA